MDQSFLSVKDSQGADSYLLVETKWLLFLASLIYFAKLPDSAESPISKMNASIAPCWGVGYNGVAAAVVLLVNM